MPWIQDEYNLIVESVELTEIGAADSHWRSSLWAILGKGTVPHDWCLKMLLEKPVEQWIRHPKFPNSPWGTYSRDQLIMVIAAVVWRGLDLTIIKNLREKVTAHGQIGGKWGVSFWLKAWMKILEGNASIVQKLLFLSAVAMNMIIWKITKKGGFNVHLFAWMIYSLPRGPVKSLCWKIFNLSYNKPLWAGVTDNYLYLAMQGKKGYDSEISTSWGYIWQENDIKPDWIHQLTPQEAGFEEIDLLKRFKVN